MLAGLSDGARPWSAARALAALLVLASGLLPVLWAAARAERGAPGGRLAELALVSCAGLPALSLCWSFSSASPAAAARAVAYTAATLGVVALALRGRDERRAGALAAITAWTAALPLALVVARDLGANLGANLGADGAGWAWLAAAAPPLAVSRLLAGGELGPPCLTLAGVALLLLAPELRRLRSLLRPGQVAAVALLVGAAAPGHAAPTVREARPLLGPYVRPGEPAPVHVALEGLSAPAAGGGRLAARSFGHRYLAPPGASAADLVATPLGGGHRLTLEWQATPGGPWERLSGERPGGEAALPLALSPHTLLVGVVGPGAPELAAALLPDVEAVSVPLPLQHLALLARGGEAVDVVVAGAGAAAGADAARALHAWAAAGGVLVLAERRDLQAVVEAPGAGAFAGPRRTGPAAPWDVRPLGAGLLIGPSGAGRLATGEATDPRWRAELPRRLRVRARRAEVEQALLSGPPPGPSPRQVRQAAAAAVAAGVALALLGVLALRLPLGRALGGGAAVAVALALGARAVAAPATPVFAVTQQVLEVPAGGRVARRLEVVRLRALRPTRAAVRLADYAPPRPRFVSALRAVQAEASLEAAGGAGPWVAAPLGAQERAFARLDAYPLAGPFEVTARGSTVQVTNASGDALRRPFALVPSGVYPLPDLPAGGTVTIDLRQPPLPLARWRWSSDDPADLQRRRLMAAALSGRDLRAGFVLVGEGRPTRRVLAGVGGERVEPPLVVVVAAVETP